MFHWAMPVDLTQQAVHVAWRGPIDLEGPEVFSLPSRLLLLLGLEQELLPAEQDRAAPADPQTQSQSCGRGEDCGVQTVLGLL